MTPGPHVESLYILEAVKDILILVWPWAHGMVSTHPHSALDELWPQICVRSLEGWGLLLFHPCELPCSMLRLKCLPLPAARVSFWWSGSHLTRGGFYLVSSASFFHPSLVHLRFGRGAMLPMLHGPCSTAMLSLFLFPISFECRQARFRAQSSQPLCLKESLVGGCCGLLWSYTLLASRSLSSCSLLLKMFPVVDITVGLGLNVHRNMGHGHGGKH